MLSKAWYTKEKVFNMVTTKLFPEQFANTIAPKQSSERDHNVIIIMVGA